MSYIELYTEDELTQLKRIAVEARDMKTYKEVQNELNRRERDDL